MKFLLSLLTALSFNQLVFHLLRRLKRLLCEQKPADPMGVHKQKVHLIFRWWCNFPLMMQNSWWLAFRTNTWPPFLTAKQLHDSLQYHRILVFPRLICMQSPSQLSIPASRRGQKIYVYLLSCIILPALQWSRSLMATDWLVYRNAL